MFPHIINPPKLGRYRRVTFLGAYLIGLGLAVVPMYTILFARGVTVLKVAAFVVFVLLQSQLVFGFTVALAGFWVLRSGSKSLQINHTLPSNVTPRDLPATAIVMPIYNEDVSRVFQGLRVMYESLEKTGRGADFDFFILSDSNDSNYWIAEEMAWLQLCKQLKGFGRIFYRNRRVTRNQKSGNIADFCRRWGANYRYMIILDADSIMTGHAFVRLASLMEKNPAAGIIQTYPKSVLGQTLFQRVMQFTGRLYGPVFMAGANFWQQESGSYWGHNAIIRLKPFMEHCAMPELPETEALGRRILSHDTIEAALMRRAGYGVWFAYDIEGSFEGSPPNLLESLQRDRRWCRGNLQHIWFLFARGLKMSSRIHIWNGMMSYLSSPIWLLLLLLGTFDAATTTSEITPVASSLFSHTVIGWCLFAYVLLLLLVPKFLGLWLVLDAPEQLRDFGGRAKVLMSALGEMIFAALLAPILMLFHTRFVLVSLTGAKVRWGGQKRDVEQAPTWRECLAWHWANTAFVLVWAGAVAWLCTGLLPWMIFVFLGPILAIPFTFVTGLKTADQNTGKEALFVIPEEQNPPWDLQKMEGRFLAHENQFFKAKNYASDYGLLQAVLDPYCNAVHTSLLRQRDSVAVRTHHYLATLGNRLLHDGPDALTAEEKYALLWDGDSMGTLHRKLWRSPPSTLHEWWATAFRRYNETLLISCRRTIQPSR
jgi:membrane glycosyltransferase